WTDLNGNGLTLTTFKGLDVSPTDPNFAIGASQDNGTEVYNNSLQWNETDGGDGGTVQIDQLNPNNVYHAINNGIQKSVDGGNTWNGLNIFGGNLYIPFVLDRINTSRIVVGGGSFGNLVAGFQFGNV